jgi:hypothetical protein
VLEGTLASRAQTLERALRFMTRHVDIVGHVAFQSMAAYFANSFNSTDMHYLDVFLQLNFGVEGLAASVTGV